MLDKNCEVFTSLCVNKVMATRRYNLLIKVGVEGLECSALLLCIDRYNDLDRLIGQGCKFSNNLFIMKINLCLFLYIFLSIFHTNQLKNKILMKLLEFLTNKPLIVFYLNEMFKSLSIMEHVGYMSLCTLHCSFEILGEVSNYFLNRQ
jgi:hypothetical protein